MTDIEHDKEQVRKIFDMFSEISKTEFKTQVAKDMGAHLASGIKEIIKPYMIRESNKMI